AAIAQGGQIAASAGNRILAEDGAWLDASGVRNVALSVANDAILVNVQGNELRDAPVNRDNPSKALYSAAGDGLWVDINDLVLVPAGTGGYATDRYYTKGGLLEVSGWLDNTPHTIGEWDAVGGTITLQAKEVVTQPGSVFNISGGSVEYQSGYVQQSYLLGTDGRIYNVNAAPADMTYAGVYHGFTVDHPRWGVTETYLSP